jgi:deoxyribonuclease IV
VADLDTRVGVHVPGIDPLAEADELGADCIQIFVADPQSFKKPPPHPHGAALKSSPLPVYVHAPYLINVCSPVSTRRGFGRRFLKQTCDAAADVGASAVIVHPGHAEDGVEEGVARWVRTVERLETTVPLFIENTAGGKNAVARRFDDLARLWDAIHSVETDVRIGFCFDTCHAYAAGEELTDAVERVTNIVGRIDLLHANDAQGEPGSGRDRHAHLGHGNIGADVLRHMIRTAGGPVIIEPHEAWKAAPDTVRSDMTFVRDALADGPQRPG